MTTTLIATLGLLVLMTIGVHVAVSMGVVSSLMVLSIDGVPLTTVAQTVFNSVNSYPLMAIPMFIFMGNLMTRGRIVSILLLLIGSIVRAVRGGLALSVMLSCVFFAAVSGSSVASASAIGAAAVNELKREMYPARFAAALVAVGGTLGLMIPPSLGFILIGSIVGLPVDQLFIAGVLPGLLEASMLLFTTYMLSRRNGYGGPPQPADPGLFLRKLPRASGALSMPVLVMGGIYMGIFTPTEVSALAAGYAIILCVIVYRTLNWREVWQASQDSILQTTMIFAVVAGGSLIGFILARMGVSASLTAFMEQLNMSPWQFLLIANVVLLILGTALDGVAMIVLTAPLLFPMAQHLGINPVHFAVIMVANVEIATLTPPIGLNVFVMSATAKLPVEEVSRGVYPFYLTRLVGLAIITYVPWFSLALLPS